MTWRTESFRKYASSFYSLLGLLLQQTKTNKNDLDILQPQIQHFKFKNEKKNLYVVAGIKRHKRQKSWQNNKSKQHH